MRFAAWSKSGEDEACILVERIEDLHRLAKACWNTKP